MKIILAKLMKRILKCVSKLRQLTALHYCKWNNWYNVLISRSERVMRKEKKKGKMKERFIEGGESSNQDEGREWTIWECSSMHSKVIR